MTPGGVYVGLLGRIQNRARATFRYQEEVRVNKLSVLMKEHWQDGISVLVGVWLAISPWVFGYFNITAPTLTSVVLGVIIAVAAGAALLKFHEWEEWVSVVMSGWLIMSPWLFNYAAMAPAAWNHVIVGLLVLALSGWSIWHFRHHPSTA